MDTLLRGKRPSEIIPVNFEVPVFYYPVRHHSPVCAWHLENVIRRYQPECILVEGPENANDLIPVLTHPDTKTPIALYYACRDSEGKLNPEGVEVSYRCYYPFLECSPELVALRWARKLNIPAEFMDLSYGQILLATQAHKGLRSDDRRDSYLTDRYLAENAFIRLLCEKAGVRGFEEFWELYFETDGMDMSDERFIRQMHDYCVLSRENTSATELLEDGCIAREAHMAQRIREAQKKHSRVLVVAGGFHILGLINAEPEQRKPMTLKNQSVYPMRYSLDAADGLLGYASGMPAPAFYRDLWRAMHAEENADPWEKTVLDYLVKTGRRLRQKGHTISSYDEARALEQALGLASLREKRSPGLYELQDGVLSCFVKGEADYSGMEPLRVLGKFTTGSEVGILCAGAPVPPLVQDFMSLCRKFRLKTDVITRQQTVLSIFSEKKHRELSCFFYRCDFLECGFAQRKKGPDLLSRKDRNLVRETWEYRWHAGVDGKLIEHSVSGGTVADACATELTQKMAVVSTSREGGRLLVQAFLMGLEDLADAMTDRMQDLLVSDGDFTSLCNCAVSLNDLHEWQAAYARQTDGRYQKLMDMCFQRIIRMLPSMHTVDDRNAAAVQKACMMVYQVTQRPAFADCRTRLIEAFEVLSACNPIHPALHGTVLGLLYGADQGWKTTIDTVIRGYLKGTRGMMLQSASFLQGLFFAARDLLLVDPEFLVLVDQLLCELEDGDFVSLLPDLRLAFSYFRPLETDRIAERAAGFHGGSRKTVKISGISPEEYSRNEQLDAWIAGHLQEYDREEDGDDF